MVGRLTLRLCCWAIAACGGSVAIPVHAQAIGQALSPEAQAAGYKRIGAVSVTADKITWYFVGATVFTNEHEEWDIADWALDKTFSAQLGEAAARVFGATYIVAAYDPAEFAAANDSKFLDFTASATWMGQKIGAAAQRYCEANRLDALVIASKLEGAERGSKQRYAGVTMSGRSNPFVDPPFFAYVSARVSLCDCRASRVVGTRVLGYVPGGKYIDFTMRMRRIPYEIAKAPPSQWNDDARSKARELIAETPGPSWEETVRAIVSPPPVIHPGNSNAGLTP